MSSRHLTPRRDLAVRLLPWGEPRPGLAQRPSPPPLPRLGSRGYCTHRVLPHLPPRPQKRLEIACLLPDGTCLC
jgi:hypothetical protein